jgi:hypothetical protein
MRITSLAWNRTLIIRTKGSHCADWADLYLKLYDLDPFGEVIGWHVIVVFCRPQ